MTIKNMDKNISAEMDVAPEGEIYDIEILPADYLTAEKDITHVNLKRKDFYNEREGNAFNLKDVFYTKQEIDKWVKIHLVIYDSFDSIPEVGQSNYIYLVPFVDKEGIKEGIYKEYVWTEINDPTKYISGQAHHNDYVVTEDGKEVHYNYESLGSTELDLSGIRADIAALDSRMDTAENDIDNLEDRVDDAEEDIVGLKSRMSTAEGDIVGLKNRMSTAEGDIDSLEEGLETANNNITSLQSRVSTAEEDINSLEEGLETANNNITSLQGRISTAEDDIDSLEGRVSSNESNISQAQSNISDLGTTKLNKSNVINELTVTSFTANDPTALSAKQGHELNEKKIDKTSIVTSLDVNDNTKVLSASQGYQLNENKINKTSIATNLSTDDNTKVLSAKQGKILDEKKVDKTTLEDYATINYVDESFEQLSYLDREINEINNNLGVFLTSSDIATNLQTDDDSKILSAKQGYNLQNNKVNKTDIVTNLTTNDNTKVLSASQGYQLQNDKADKTFVVEIIDELINQFGG